MNSQIKEDIKNIAEELSEEYGEDAGEIIIEDAEVVRIIK